ncbi:MAG TPA: VWA domain-containing protein [Anaerolineaceae bacterium]|jgi:uncharacterized protein YegL|nr:VWA domain-containing protein [Anaerolineaceae bacterium]HOR83688.1 VWA domain-containing protein [Anaerolineaceae bacterium]HPL43488.1 VWA domain-containing protein [Anaerolineaceae bacterium]HPY33137.1 VWA domain-containing protein [Anaerolineaceae bacterium]HQJ91117.1 VWA domain-containing protein [Paludibacteraceae bacterium]
MDNFNAFHQEEFPTVLSPNESHMACLLLLDTSGSMDGDPIKQLNKALNEFKETVCKDPRTRERVDIAVVEFNDSPTVRQGFVPIPEMNTFSLKAGGGTNMTAAFRTAIPMIKERTRILKKAGAQPYKPWIVLISDGFDNNIREISQEIAQQSKEGKLKVIALGVEGYDSDTLHELAPGGVIKLHGYNFSEFFDWLHKSFAVISSKSPGEPVVGEMLTENMDIDPKKDTTNILNN